MAAHLNLPFPGPQPNRPPIVPKPDRTVVDLSERTPPMADYIEITDAGGTKRKVSVDEVASQFVQRLKMQFGADGSATDVSAESPLPVGDAAVLAKLGEILTALGLTLKVGDGVGALTVDGTVTLGAGTAAIGKLAANSGVDIGDVDVTSLTGGTIAHDAVDSGNPLKVGARARTELAAAVSQDDRSDLMADKYGRLLTAPTPLGQRVSATLARTTNESGQLLAALAEGAYVITAISVTNAHATVATKVEILDNETVKWKGYAGAVGGGFVVCDPNGLFVTTKNQAVKGKCVTTGADVDITVSGYKIPA